MPTSTQFHGDHVVPGSRWARYLAGELLVQPVEGQPEPNHLDNFAWSCPYCNVAKGNRVSGRTGRRAFRLFHPRRDRWEEHFVFTGGYLLVHGVTDVGLATERVLRFNDARPNGPVVAWHYAILRGFYPPEWVRTRGF